MNEVPIIIRVGLNRTATVLPSQVPPNLLQGLLEEWEASLPLEADEPNVISL